MNPPKKVSRKSSGQNDIKIRYTNCDTYGEAYETNKEIFKKKLNISRHSNNEDLFKKQCLSVGNNCWIKDHPDVLIESNRPHLQCRKKAIKDTVLLQGETIDQQNADDMISYFCPKNFTEKYEKSLYSNYTEQCYDKFKLVKIRYLAFKASLERNQIPSSIFKYVPTYNGSHRSITIIDVDQSNIQSILDELLNINIVMRTIAYNVVKELKMIDACNAMFEAFEWIAQNIQNFNKDFIIFASGNDDPNYIDPIQNFIDSIAQDVHECGYMTIWGEADSDHIDVKNEVQKKFENYLYDDQPFEKNDKNIKFFSNKGIVNSDLIIFCVCGIVVNEHNVGSLGHDMIASPLLLYWIKTLPEDSLKRSRASTLLDAAKIILIYNVGHEIGHSYQGLVVYFGLQQFIPIYNAQSNCYDCRGLYTNTPVEAASDYIKRNNLREKEMAIEDSEFFAEIVAETFGLLCVEYYLRENFTDIQDQLTVFHFFFLGLCASPANIPHLGYSTRIKLLKSNKYLYDLYKQLDKPYFRGGEVKLKKSRRRKL